MAKIGLIDVDGHNFPNLALMKISAWHKAQGDQVEWWWGWNQYDRVYMSKVFDDTYSDLLIKCGYNVLVVDYAGKTDGELYTIYPFSLEKANYNVFPETITELPDNPKQSCWYVWATLMMRGITFLEAQPEITKGKISVFGVKMGAFQIWKTAYLCKDLACGVALFNSGYVPELNLDGMKDSVAFCAS